MCGAKRPMVNLSPHFDDVTRSVRISGSSGKRFTQRWVSSLEQLDGLCDGSASRYQSQKQNDDAYTISSLSVLSLKHDEFIDGKKDLHGRYVNIRLVFIAP